MVGFMNINPNLSGAGAGAGSGHDISQSRVSVILGPKLTGNYRHHRAAGKPTAWAYSLSGPNLACEQWASGLCSQVQIYLDWVFFTDESQIWFARADAWSQLTCEVSS